MRGKPLDRAPVDSATVAASPRAPSRATRRTRSVAAPCFALLQPAHERRPAVQHDHVHAAERAAVVHHDRARRSVAPASAENATFTLRLVARRR